MLEILTIWLTLTLFAIWIYGITVRPVGYPSGPFIFPILGSFPLIGSDPLKTFKKWRQKYGDIFSVRFGNYNVVIIHDYKLIKDALNENGFSGRPFLKPFKLIAGEEKRGLVASDGQQWVEQRRFSLKNLRDFGFGKQSLEAIVHEDIRDFINEMKTKVGHPVSTGRSFNISVFNSLWNIICSERFEQNDPTFMEVSKSIREATSTASVGGPVFFMPWLTWVAPEWTGWNKFKIAVPKAKKLISKYIEDHKTTFQADNLRDFIDVHIKEIQRTIDPDSSFHGKSGEENMLVGILNLFAAGSETTSSTLNWSVLFLSRHQDVMAKLQSEIDHMVGNSRLPSLTDREKMPYTQAFIMEVLRKSTLIPLGLPHNCMTDTQFQGYNIPKDTIIFANIHSVHYEEKVWGDPNNFRPERFLTKDGKQINPEHPPIIPFSIGKRVCLGETLARNNFFLFLTSLCQRFNIRPDAAENGPIVEPLGLFRFPPPFKVVFEDRHET